MTKSDLIEHLCLSEKIPKGKAELLVNAIFECMEEALRRGERIEIRGFGSFEIRSYKPYDGRNPRTGTQVAVRAKRLPFFKVGKELKERVNGPEPTPADARKTSSNGHGNGHASNGASNGHHVGDGAADAARPAQAPAAPVAQASLASPSPPASLAPPPGEAKAKAS